MEENYGTKQFNLRVDRVVEGMPSTCRGGWPLVWEDEHTMICTKRAHIYYVNSKNLVLDRQNSNDLYRRVEGNRLEIDNKQDRPTNLLDG